MVVRSPYPDIAIPEVDLLTYAFGDGKDLSDRPLWIDSLNTNHYLTKRTSLQWIKRLGLGLQRLGLKHGQVVLHVSPNHIFVPIAYLGVAGYGFIFSGANPAYTADELAYQMKNSEAAAVLVHPALLPTARKAAKQAGIHENRLFLFSDEPNKPSDGIQDWRSMIASPEDAEKSSWPHFPVESLKNQVATVNYSSGTTGLPKGVMVTQYNLIANTEQVKFQREIERAPDDIDPANDKWVGFLPLYHAYGQLNLIMLAARLNAATYIMKAFDIEALFRLIESEKINDLSVAPPILVFFSKHPAASKYDLTSLRHMTSGAAPLAQSLQNEVSQRFHVSIKQGWGMTEVTCAGTLLPHGIEDNTGSVGCLVPNTEVKLIDDDGNEAAQGDRGEIYVRGPNVCAGYWRNDAATRECMEDGWLKTGDVAVYDKKGKFWIVDRKKELIKVSGLQVAPAELEAVLLTHPAVADAGVVGHEDSFGSQEKVWAYVSLKKKGSVNARDIEEWMKTKVSKHKWLTGGAHIVDTIPKSPAGKIQRKVMREWAKKESQAGRPRL